MDLKSIKGEFDHPNKNLERNKVAPIFSKQPIRQEIATVRNYYFLICLYEGLWIILLLMLRN